MYTDEWGTYEPSTIKTCTCGRNHLERLGCLFCTVYNTTTKRTTIAKQEEQKVNRCRRYLSPYKHKDFVVYT